MALTFSNLKSKVSDFYNNRSLGRFSNPSSPDYTGPKTSALQNKANPSPLKTPVSLPSSASVSSNFQTQNPQYQYKSDVKPVTSANPVQTKSVPATPTASIAGMSQRTAQPISNDYGTGGVDSSGTYVPSIGKNLNQANVEQISPFNKSVETLGGISTGANPAQQSIAGLQGIAQNQTPQVAQAQKQYNDFAQKSPFILSDVRNNPNVAAEVSVGRGQALGQTLSAQQQALAQGVTNALAGQGQQITAGQDAGALGLQGQTNQISAAQNAGNLSQPVAGASYFGSPTTGGLVGGQGGGGNQFTGNSLVDNSINSAIDIVKRGGSTDDAMKSIVGGDVGTQAFISAMRKYDPSWTPTSSNAIAQQNMTQGQQYQQQASQLSTTLQQLDKLTPVVTDFITKSGLNSQDNPFYNKAINEYKSQLQNPADIASLNAMMADVKTYTAQILGSSGLNPTEVSATVNSFDPSLLNAGQLTSFLDNLKNLGQIRLQPLQQSATGSYGTGGGFMGGTANPSNTSSYAPQNAQSPLNTSNPVTQGLIGGTMGLFGSINNLIKGTVSKILER